MSNELSIYSSNTHDMWCMLIKGGREFLKIWKNGV